MSVAAVESFAFEGHAVRLYRDGTSEVIVPAPGPPQRINGTTVGAEIVSGPSPHGGEAKDFATVERLSLGGALPINTSGGLLGEAYIRGMNGIAESVRRIRGTSVNQVRDVGYVLVTAGTGVPTSGLIPRAP